MKKILLKKYTQIIFVWLALILSLSCNVFSAKNDNIATSTTIPLSTDTPLPPAPTSTLPSPVPTSTRLSPTQTSTPIPPLPTSTTKPTRLNDTGPYILFSSATGIWIANPDGSFLTKLSDLILDNQNLHRAISPQGDRIALVVRNEQGIDLMEIRIPGGETKLIARLLSATHEELVNNPTSAKAITSYAITGYYNSIAWQPNSGQLLAFIGAINGPTADLYSYDTQSEKITQLTSGPSQAIDPNWSPDGKFIVHFGVSWVPPFGGAIGGANRLDGAWAVQISDGKVITLPKPKGVNDNFVGWQDDSHYITYDRDDKCFAQNLHSVGVANAEITSMMDLSFYYQIVQSPENKALLFAGADGCANSPGEGIFLLPAGQSTPTKLDTKRAYQVDWLFESGVFQAYPEALFSPDGTTRYDPPLYDHSYNPAISKKGYQAWEVIESQKGRVMVLVPGGKWQTTLNGFFVDALIWDPITGETLLIVLDDGSLYAASYPDFTPRSIGNMGGGTRQAIWLR